MYWIGAKLHEEFFELSNCGFGVKELEIGSNNVGGSVL
jgi:hypothetical protein